MASCKIQESKKKARMFHKFNVLEMNDDLFEWSNHPKCFTATLSSQEHVSNPEL